MKLFHRMMMLTLILCLVFGLGGCTQEKSPSEPEQSSMQTVEPPEEPGTEPLTFESADLGITFDLPDSLQGHSKIMVGDREHDVYGAKKTGLSVIGVLYGYGSREELQSAGTDYLCETPEETAKLLKGMM